MGDAEPYDAVILDIGLPEMDGITVREVARRRQDHAGADPDRPRSMERQGSQASMPARTIMWRTFPRREVLARIRALIRRARRARSSEIVAAPSVSTPRAPRRPSQAWALKLTSHEFRSAFLPHHHMGQVVSRTELVEHMYDQDFDRDSNTIEVFIGRPARRSE